MWLSFFVGISCIGVVKTAAAITRTGVPRLDNPSQ